MDFSGRTVIVTGGQGALGSEVVRRFLDAGANVAIPVRPSATGEPAKEHARQGAARVIERPCDVTAEQDVAGFVSAVRKELGPPDVLVHAAGGYDGGKRVDEMPAEMWDRMLSLNLRSAFLFAKEVLPSMFAKRYGRLVFVSAATALRPTARSAAYAVAKRGILTLMEVLAEEVKGTGVTANAVAPSILDTPANRQSMPEADWKRWVRTEDLASTILYLCSPEAREVNGATLPLRGGV